MIKLFGNVELLEDLGLVVLLVLVRHENLLYCEEFLVRQAKASVNVPKCALSEADFGFRGFYMVLPSWFFLIWGVIISFFLGIWANFFFKIS